MILPCLIRHRAANAIEGASIYPACQNLLLAARALGYDRVPLLCAREIPVPRALPRVIRVLIHYYAEDDHESRHVYLGDASALRADLEAAQ